MGAVTSADLVLTLDIPIVFASPQQIQGFATDEAFDFPTIKSAEVMMGVDGILSDSFVYVPIPQTISLQADSASNDVFDQWWALAQANKTTYRANGLIKLPSIARKFTLTQGVLTGYKPGPNAKRLLQPRTFEITWQGFAPAPT